jgi:drug/metabolite transporter (DMT)-like permease
VGFALALFTTMLWGTLPVAIKPLLASMSTLTITWYRYVIAAVLLTAFLRWRGKLPIPTDLRSMAPWLVGAVIGFAGNNLLFLAGLNYVGASAGEVVIQLAPIMLILAGILLLKEPFSLWQWLGIAVLLGGMAIFFYRDLAGAIASPGVLLIVLASVLWAAYAIFQKQLQRSLPPLSILWIMYVSGALLLLPFAEPGQVRALDTLGWVFLIYCALNILIAYTTFAQAMAHWEVSRVSAVVATTPLFTVIFSELAARLWPGRVAHEGLDWLQFAGGVLVAGGSIVAALARRRET